MAARRRRCAFCSDPLPKDARPNRKFCDDDCRRGKAKPDPTAPLGQVAQATDEAIAAATHLTAMDAGAVAALRVLAKKLDALASEEVTSVEDLKAKFDNVTVPTYLKYCESLGLTPAGRVRFAAKPKEEKPRGKLGQLRSVPKPAQA